MWLRDIAHNDALEINKAIWHKVASRREKICEFELDLNSLECLVEPGAKVRDWFLCEGLV